MTGRYTFSERGGFIHYGETPLFDVRSSQPEIHLYKLRFAAGGEAQSMVKYIEFSNAFKAVGSEGNFVLFIADNALLVDVEEGVVRVNRIRIEMASVFLGEVRMWVGSVGWGNV